MVLLLEEEDKRQKRIEEAGQKNYKESVGVDVAKLGAFCQDVVNV